MTWSWLQSLFSRGSRVVPFNGVAPLKPVAPFKGVAPMALVSTQISSSPEEAMFGFKSVLDDKSKPDVATFNHIHLNNIKNIAEEGRSSIETLVASLDEVVKNTDVQLLVAVAKSRNQDRIFGLYFLSHGVNIIISPNGKSITQSNYSVGIVDANHFAYNLLPSSTWNLPCVLLDIPTGAHKVVLIPM